MYAWATLLPVLVALPIGVGGAVLFALRGYGLGITAFNVSIIVAVALGVGIAALSVIGAALVWQRRLEAAR